MTENGVVFVYPNRLNPARDAFSEIVDSYAGGVRREYVVNSPGVTADDVSYDGVRLRMGKIVETLGANEKAKVVLAGYSPLVAVVHDVAEELGLDECYYIRSPETHKFEEITLKPYRVPVH